MGASTGGAAQQLGGAIDFVQSTGEVAFLNVGAGELEVDLPYIGRQPLGFGEEGKGVVVAFAGGVQRGQGDISEGIIRVILNCLLVVRHGFVSLARMFLEDSAQGKRLGELWRDGESGVHFFHGIVELAVISGLHGLFEESARLGRDGVLRERDGGIVSAVGPT